ncbi:tRNA dihydrouridine(16) synthase DusC [Aliiglaciecola lipolytica]|uniref:tRNA-dihydrouridine(16) synthase n=1 Tax=Aliiglaciecola lipolytica E3 TaxID=1127673 RepID=K6YRV0_9ALTE|nr:tRNA dihydrouridine(16) synthase DusC [Aliiglaciecola lipolytica]GAC14040.1 tRNA-dihydrouridine synthase C [Aliiglaciecola lipolytica E3]
MKIVLAPMEGVVDHLMRDMLTQVGGFDLCVTEFVRVVEQLLPNKVFYRLCPELHHQGFTPSGVPVKVQLLGQEPDWLAENAVRAIELGSHGVDLNFGCPAKTVNKSKGGAVLLKEPEVLYRIVSAVRKAVPEPHQVTAKMRLGFEDKTLAIENAQAIEAAGANSLAIHARTKTEGYKPPAYWDWIGKIKLQTQIPIIANGEIWSKRDAQMCQQQSLCSDIMLGRGALALPNLAQVVRNNAPAMTWEEVKELLLTYSGYEIFGDKGRYYPNRIKQWLGYLKVQFPQAESLFLTIRSMSKSADIVSVLQQSPNPICDAKI